MALAAISTSTTDPSFRRYPRSLMKRVPSPRVRSTLASTVSRSWATTSRRPPPPRRSGLPKVPPLPDEARPVPEGAFDVGFYGLAIVGHDLVQPHPAQLVGGVAEHVLQRRVGLQDALGAAIHQVEALRGLLDHRPVALLALAEGLLGPLALGYVALVDHHAPHARIIQQVVEKEFGVAPGAVLVRHPELEGRVDPRLRPDLGERPSPLLEVIRAHVVEDSFAHQLLGRVARYPLYRGADVGYGAHGAAARDDPRGPAH